MLFLGLQAWMPRVIGIHGTRYNSHSMQFHQSWVGVLYVSRMWYMRHLWSATRTCAGYGQEVKLRPMCSTCRVLGPIATLVLSDLKRKLHVLPSESVANGNVDITLLFVGQYRSFLSCATAGLSAQPACTFLTKRGWTCAKTKSITPSRPPIS